MSFISPSQRKSVLFLLTVVLLLICLQLSPFRIRQSQLGTPTSKEIHSSSETEDLRTDDDQAPWENPYRVRAAFVILTRNSELDALRKTMQQLEARFNRKFNYPYVFLNNEEFTDEFKQLTAGLTKAKVQYGNQVWIYKHAPGWM